PSNQTNKLYVPSYMGYHLYEVLYEDGSLNINEILDVQNLFTELRGNSFTYTFFSNEDEILISYDQGIKKYTQSLNKLEPIYNGQAYYFLQWFDRDKVILFAHGMGEKQVLDVEAGIANPLDEILSESLVEPTNE